MEQGIRLQKYMAEAGIGSRRKCEEWIVRGMVQVNGSVHSASKAQGSDPRYDFSKILNKNKGFF